MRLRQWAAIALLAAIATGCESNDLWKPIPAFGGGGGGGSSWQGQPPPWAPKPVTPARPAPTAPGATTTVTPPLAPGAEMIANDPRPGDYSNYPGEQEVHWMSSYNSCRNLYNKLKSQGVNLTGYKFDPARMPGDRGAGQCKLFGPGTIDNRFSTDNRYDN